MNLDPTPSARGLSAVRYLRAMTLAKGDPVAAQAYAESQNWSDRNRVVQAIRAAVDAVDSTSAAGLMQPVGTDLVELVAAASIVGRLPALRRVPMNVRSIGMTAGSAAGWRGEGSAIRVSRAAVASIGTLTPLSVAAIIVTTAELARLSDPSVDAVLRRDLQRALAAALDAAFIDAANAGDPGVKPASVTNGVSAIPSTGSSIAQIGADLHSAITALLDAGGDLGAAAWVMHPRSAAFLAGLRGTTGGPVHPEVTALGGRLVGLPVITSASVPVAATTGEPTIIALVDSSGITFAQDGAHLEVAHHATLQLDDAPTDDPSEQISLWQENLAAWRGVLYTNWSVARAGSVQYISGVTY